MAARDWQVIDAFSPAFVFHLLGFYPVGSYLLWREKPSDKMSIVLRSTGDKNSSADYKVIPLILTVEEHLAELGIKDAQCAFPKPWAWIPPASGASVVDQQQQQQQLQLQATSRPQLSLFSIPSDLLKFVICHLPLKSLLALRLASKVR